MAGKLQRIAAYKKRHRSGRRAVPERQDRTAEGQRNANHVQHKINAMAVPPDPTGKKCFHARPPGIRYAVKTLTLAVRFELPNRSQLPDQLQERDRVGTAHPDNRVSVVGEAQDHPHCRTGLRPQKTCTLAPGSPTWVGPF